MTCCTACVNCDQPIRKASDDKPLTRLEALAGQVLYCVACWEEIPDA